VMGTDGNIYHCKFHPMLKYASVVFGLY